MLIKKSKDIFQIRKAKKIKRQVVRNLNQKNQKQIKKRPKSEIELYNIKKRHNNV